MQFIEFRVSSTSIVATEPPMTAGACMSECAICRRADFCRGVHVGMCYLPTSRWLQGRACRNVLSANEPMATRACMSECASCQRVPLNLFKGQTWTLSCTETRFISDVNCRWKIHFKEQCTDRYSFVAYQYPTTAASILCCINSLHPTTALTRCTRPLHQLAANSFSCYNLLLLWTTNRINSQRTLLVTTIFVATDDSH